MPIPCNGVCCNYSVAPAYQSVKHNISGFSGLVQVERRFSDTGCNSWHCFLKGQTSLLRFNVRYSIECLFIISSWGDGAAYNNDRHGIQHTLCRLTTRLLGSDSRDIVAFWELVTTARNQIQSCPGIEVVHCPVLRLLDFPARSNDVTDQPRQRIPMLNGRELSLSHQSL